MGLKESKKYEGRVAKGIALHRIIDDFTDKHEASLELRSILRKRHGKYASVVVDLIWDYCLSTEWTKYSSQSLRSFADQCYKQLNLNKHEMPDKLLKRFENMVADDFLMAYANKQRMTRSLEWMDKRVQFPSQFVNAVEDLNQNEEVIIDLFNDFFPDMISHIDQHCNC